MSKVQATAQSERRTGLVLFERLMTAILLAFCKRLHRMLA
jgi:hypothetical protein